MVAAGYNGIYFDVIDEYTLKWAQTNDPHAEQDMVNLVESLKAYATSATSTGASARPIMIDEAIMMPPEALATCLRTLRCSRAQWPKIFAGSMSGRRRMRY